MGKGVVSQFVISKDKVVAAMDAVNGRDNIGNLGQFVEDELLVLAKDLL